MIIAAILTLIFIMFFVVYSHRNSRQSVKLATIVALLVIWIGYFFVLLNKTSSNTNNRYYLILIPILLFAAYMIYNLAKPKPQHIIAKQQNYWGIDPKIIYSSYAYRCEERSDRVETKINKLSKRIIREYSGGDKFYTTNLIKKICELSLTEIKSTKELDDIYLYKLIFEKIKGFITSREEDIDFEKLLEQNGYIAEYFLIDLWVTHTKAFNIGTANLDVYACRSIERELVGALDNADMNSVKRQGAALYYKYAEFKNLMPKV